MPRLSDTMTEGKIVGWMKKVGDKIKPGDVLADVETDKATMELESYNDGVLLHIGVEAGNAVQVDGILAIVGKAGEDFKDLLTDKKAESPSAVVEALATASAPTKWPPQNSDWKRALPRYNSTTANAPRHPATAPDSPWPGTSAANLSRASAARSLPTIVYSLGTTLRLKSKGPCSSRNAAYSTPCSKMPRPCNADSAAPTTPRSRTTSKASATSRHASPRRSSGSACRPRKHPLANPLPSTKAPMKSS